jgi:hypothetical protein
MGWWPERESNPRHEDFQWRVAKLPLYFQLVAKIKSWCATECATAIGKFQAFVLLLKIGWHPTHDLQKIRGSRILST